MKKRKDIEIIDEGVTPDESDEIPREVQDEIDAMNRLTEKYHDKLDPKKNKKDAVFNDEFIKVTEELKKESDIVFVKPGFFDKFTKKKIDSDIDKIKLTEMKRKSIHDKKQLSMKVKDKLNLIKRKHMLDLKGYLDERKDKKNPGQSFMVNMELRNGMHTHFLVMLAGGFFDYEDGRYIIDDNYKYYDVSSKIYCLDYHQDCSIPLKRRFNMLDVYRALEGAEDADTETAINPKSLKIFMESDIIQKVMRGAEMENWIKFVKLMLIILTVISSVMLLLLLKIAFNK
jgi:hypothetical protein